MRNLQLNAAHRPELIDHRPVRQTEAYFLPPPAGLFPEEGEKFIRIAKVHSAHPAFPVIHYKLHTVLVLPAAFRPQNTDLAASELRCPVARAERFQDIQGADHILCQVRKRRNGVQKNFPAQVILRQAAVFIDSCAELVQPVSSDRDPGRHGMAAEPEEEI